MNSWDTTPTYFGKNILSSWSWRLYIFTKTCRSIFFTIYMYFILWIWFNKRTHWSKTHGMNDFKTFSSSSSSWDSTDVYYGIKFHWVHFPLVEGNSIQFITAQGTKSSIFGLSFTCSTTGNGFSPPHTRMYCLLTYTQILSFLRRWNRYLTARFCRLL
jgi:hypothetical protein